jgi:hypothetical protein
MRNRMFLSSPSSVLVLAIFVSAFPAIARPSGTGSGVEVGTKVDKVEKTEKKKIPAAQPRQEQTKKVYTNDDFGWYNPSASAAGASQSAQSVPAAPETSAASSGVQPTPLDSQQDPQWYARQVASLENELAAVQSREDALQQFRATSSGLRTGLVLNAPTEGISTDNLIAQLDARRQQIMQQLDDLADLARVNGLPPGTVNQPSAPEQPSPTLAQQQDALTTQYRDISDQLAENQAVQDDMQQQAAARNITLLPSVPGQGGNLTTNLLDNLNSQADVLQSSLSDAEDNARTLGVQPGDLH